MKNSNTRELAKFLACESERSGDHQYTIRRTLDTGEQMKLRSSIMQSTKMNNSQQHELNKTSNKQNRNQLENEFFSLSPDHKSQKQEEREAKKMTQFDNQLRTNKRQTLTRFQLHSRRGHYMILSLFVVMQLALVCLVDAQFLFTYEISKEEDRAPKSSLFDPSAFKIVTPSQLQSSYQKMAAQINHPPPNSSPPTSAQATTSLIELDPDDEDEQLADQAPNQLSSSASPASVSMSVSSPPPRNSLLMSSRGTESRLASTITENDNNMNDDDPEEDSELDDAEEADSPSSSTTQLTPAEKRASVSQRSSQQQQPAQSSFLKQTSAALHSFAELFSSLNGPGSSSSQSPPSLAQLSLAREAARGASLELAAGAPDQQAEARSLHDHWTQEQQRAHQIQHQHPHSHHQGNLKFVQGLSPFPRGLSLADAALKSFTTSPTVHQPAPPFPPPTTTANSIIHYQQNHHPHAHPQRPHHQAHPQPHAQPQRVMARSPQHQHQHQHLQSMNQKQQPTSSQAAYWLTANPLNAPDGNFLVEIKHPPQATSNNQVVATTESANLVDSLLAMSLPREQQQQSINTQQVATSTHQSVPQHAHDHPHVQQHQHQHHESRGHFQPKAILSQTSAKPNSQPHPTNQLDQFIFSPTPSSYLSAPVIDSTGSARPASQQTPITTPIQSQLLMTQQQQQLQNPINVPDHFPLPPAQPTTDSQIMNRPKSAEETLISYRIQQQQQQQQNRPSSIIYQNPTSTISITRSQQQLEANQHQDQQQDPVLVRELKPEFEPADSSSAITNITNNRQHQLEQTSQQVSTPTNQPPPPLSTGAVLKPTANEIPQVSPQIYESFLLQQKDQHEKHMELLKQQLEINKLLEQKQRQEAEESKKKNKSSRNNKKQQQLQKATAADKELAEEQLKKQAIEQQEQEQQRRQQTTVNEQNERELELKEAALRRQRKLEQEEAARRRRDDEVKRRRQAAAAAEELRLKQERLALQQQQQEVVRQRQQQEQEARERQERERLEKERREKLAAEQEQQRRKQQEETERLEIAAQQKEREKVEQQARLLKQQNEDMKQFLELRKQDEEQREQRQRLMAQQQLQLQRSRNLQRPTRIPQPASSSTTELPDSLSSLSPSPKGASAGGWGTPIGQRARSPGLPTASSSTSTPSPILRTTPITTTTSTSTASNPTVSTSSSGSGGSSTSGPAENAHTSSNRSARLGSEVGQKFKARNKKLRSNESRRLVVTDDKSIRDKIPLYSGPGHYGLYRNESVANDVAALLESVSLPPASSSSSNSTTTSNQSVTSPSTTTTTMSPDVRTTSASAFSPSPSEELVSSSLSPLLVKTHITIQNQVLSPPSDPLNPIFDDDVPRRARPSRGSRNVAATQNNHLQDDQINQQHHRTGQRLSSNSWRPASSMSRQRSESIGASPSVTQATSSSNLSPVSVRQSSADSRTARIGLASLPPDSDNDGIPGRAGIEYPVLAAVPQTSFSCAKQPLNGYYADTETACQVVHLCQSGTQSSILCPNGTIFNQEKFSCQWWYEVNCSRAPTFYQLNDNLYKLPSPADSTLTSTHSNESYKNKHLRTNSSHARVTSPISLGKDDNSDSDQKQPDYNVNQLRASSSRR